MNTVKRKKTSRKGAKTQSIGTRNESSLHRTLKFQYAGTGGRTEEAAGEFVSDAITKEGEYIEVQTGSFGPLRKKVKVLAASGKVRIIHPIAVNKYIEVYAPPAKKRKKHSSSSSPAPCAPPRDGQILIYRRKSPKKGSLWDLFDALIHAPELPLIKGVRIEIVLSDITEKRVKDGKGAWRRKGVSIADKELSAYHEKTVLKKPSDYLRFIPFKRNEEFTTSLLADRAGINKNKAQKALYVLAKMGVVKRTGKKGHAWVYEIS